MGWLSGIANITGAHLESYDYKCEPMHEIIPLIQKFQANKMFTENCLRVEFFKSVLYNPEKL